ncbi:HAMP domain-containing histidine kinase [Weissella ceti]|uniref:histidine kinase n=1 Tax=Weissella ceti TaxID=759620 RepID=A0ABT3E5B9_9LACO|nr:HAMP domain-containing sensor histidine kinase [Weissella ceti]MCW0953424.1 HAMP domain-containing histidine kinase [Weissella ceti]QVK12027.1 HAMP domain-containing histidine kinase [Weissella ceti]
MKPKAWSWLLFGIKSVVSALFFVFSAFGIAAVLNMLQIEVSPVIWSVVALINVIGWIFSLIHFYEQMMLAYLTNLIRQLENQVTKVDGQYTVPNMHWGHRLNPMAHGVVRLFKTAQQAMQEQRNIERSKDEMITNVSHDLRTPLTSILGYLGLIVPDETPIDSKQAKTYAKTAYHKAEQMKSLVEDLFDYTQVQQVDFKLRWAPMDLGAMLEQLAVSYELEAKEHGMVISTITAAKRIEMIGDSDRLARVFMNLISNALKYGDGATFIRLSAKVDELANVVEVRITNNGVKIPEEAVARLFDRFYRVESSRNLGTGGTGLGLAIVQSVIDAHNGTVNVESTDEMTSFIVRLPLLSEEDIIEE